jgi:ParB-like chromosome segregation protein Spo0J
VKIPLEMVLLPPPVPAGMNVLVLMSLTYAIRTGGNVAPIRVTEEGEFFRITDGRHRFMASVIAGREWVDAKVGKR